MSEIDKIKQSQTLGANGTQIGVQNINVGLTPQAAAEMAIDLFRKNFPDLLDEACKAARERVDELNGRVVYKLEDEGVKDFSAFKEPDVQYTLLKAQNEYARFGTAEMLDTLSGLLCKRVRFDNDFKLKVTIDKAIEIASVLTTKQINYLSFLFLRDYAKEPLLNINDKKAKFSREEKIKHKINRKEMKQIVKQAREELVSIDFHDIQYLLMHGCLILNLHSITNRYITRTARTKVKFQNFFYTLASSIISSYIGKELLQEDDYSLSYVGIILAITNLETEIGEKYDPHEWIK